MFLVFHCETVLGVLWAFSLEPTELSMYYGLLQQKNTRQNQQRKKARGIKSGEKKEQAS